jgi:hypothetical protein
MTWRFVKLNCYTVWLWYSNAAVMAILVFDSSLVAALFTFILFLRQIFLFYFDWDLWMLKRQCFANLT